MKIFKGFNPDGPACPICKTTNDLPCVLVPIYGTNDGKKRIETYEAKAIHVDCIDLLYYPLALEKKGEMIDIMLQEVEVKGEH